MQRIGSPKLPAGDTLSEMFASLDDGSLTRAHRVVETNPGERSTTVGIEDAEVVETTEAPSLAVDTADEDGRMTDPVAVRQFILAGKATVTLVSKTTGSRFTFKVKASEDRRVHFVSLLNGPDNTSQYAYFGYIRGGIFFHGGVKARVADSAPSAKAFKWSWAHFSRGIIPASLEVWHEGRCGMCGRKLTVPSSIRSGLGPECAGKVGF